MNRVYAATHCGFYARVVGRVGTFGLSDPAELFVALLKLKAAGRLPHIREIELIEGELGSDRALQLLSGGAQARNLVSRCPARGSLGHPTKEDAAVEWIHWAHPHPEQGHDDNWIREVGLHRYMPLCRGREGLAQYARDVGGITCDQHGRWYALTSPPIWALVGR